MNVIREMSATTFEQKDNRKEHMLAVFLVLNKDKGITFHHFSKNPEKRSFWIKIVNRMDWTLTKTSVLCSQHFTDDCFDKTSLLKININRVMRGYPLWVDQELIKAFTFLSSFRSPSTSNSPADYQTVTSSRAQHPGKVNENNAVTAPAIFVNQTGGLTCKERAPTVRL
ncbi:hypothetical protein NQ317_013489 [Molorchus minor]|uniref:THAP-type domain-containing protein n=1 Tax=Molorchus minor TaxID=1323400 RepID=A0ABQ9J9Y6_9CUCU|nr:hypothetical protein NQ317_013489 [Molorchus minor]